MLLMMMFDYVNVLVEFHVAFLLYIFICWPLMICITGAMNNTLSNGKHASGIPLQLPRLPPSPSSVVDDCYI